MPDFFETATNNANIVTFTLVPSTTAYFLRVSVRRDPREDEWLATWEYLPDWVGNGKTTYDALTQLMGALVPLLAVLLGAGDGKLSEVSNPFPDIFEIPLLTNATTRP